MQPAEVQTLLKTLNSQINSSALSSSLDDTSFVKAVKLHDTLSLTGYISSHVAEGLSWLGHSSTCAEPAGSFSTGPLCPAEWPYS